MKSLYSDLGPGLQELFFKIKARRQSKVFSDSGVIQYDFTSDAFNEVYKISLLMEIQKLLLLVQELFLEKLLKWQYLKSQQVSSTTFESHSVLPLSSAMA